MESDAAAVGTQEGVETAMEPVSVIRPSSQVAQVTRKINEILRLLSRENNLEVVEEMYGELQRRVEIFTSAFEEQANRLDISEPDRRDLEDWYQEKRSIMAKSVRKIQEWITSTRERSVKPGDSVSVASSRGSNRSGCSKASSSARLELSKRQAELKVQEELNIQLRKIQEEKRIAQRKREDEELKMKRAAEEEEDRFQAMEREARLSSAKKEIFAMKTVLDQFDGVRDYGNAPHDDSKPITSSLQQSVVNPDIGYETHISRQINLLAEISERSYLPKSEPKIFDGQDPTSYKTFILSFERLIVSKTKSDSDKLHYLEKYTSGNPNALVQSCFYMSPKEGYRAARKLLDDKYGNEFLISNAFLKKLRDWPAIRNDDRQGLEKFNTYLQSIRNFMKDMSSLSQLNGPNQIQEIVRKLPYQMRIAWRKQAFKMLESKKSVNFDDLATFVAQQSRLLSLPIFGEITDGGPTKEKKSEFGSSLMNKKSMSMATGTSAEFRRKDDCLACKKNNHTLENCFFLTKRSMEDKIEFIQKNGLCFSCLKPGHVARSCKDRLQCKKCPKKHPTCLHKGDSDVNNRGNQIQEDKRSEAAEVLQSTSACCLEEASFQTRAGQSKRVALALIPVKVRAEGSSKVIITYAGLDNFSTDCFISDKILEDLGISGPKTNINLTTMECKNKSVPTRAISGLEISDLNENERIRLPVVFSKSYLPISKDDVVTQKDCLNYDHLADIPYDYVDADVGLMLGANVPEALIPLEVVSGTRNEPYASRHKIGWAINGPIGLQEEPRLKVKVNFTQTEYKSIEKELQMMYLQDFKDCGEDGFGPSVNDQIWLKKMKNSIHKDAEGHYCLALPFKEDELNLPDNRTQALNRLGGIKRKLERNKEFHSDYVEFMKMMIDKDFSEKVPQDELSVNKNRRWYIVHHGVYHKQKHKLRVVFNCSLKYAGISLNDMLLSGPDLTNSLLGVLLRFRRGEVAVMGDVEKMFYQVRIPQEDRDLLRYFWYPEGDPSQDPVEYRLKVHVFGATSSPSCANFALRQAALDFETEATRMAVETIKNDFYVDDLLTSVDTEDQARELIGDIRQICASGHFNLTQMISNKRSVLDSIPMQNRTTGVQDLDFSRADLPVERALGILWNVQDDVLGFKIKIRENPKTRRGVLSTIHSIYDPLGFVGPAILPAKHIFQELCRQECGWDQDLPIQLRVSWDQWLKALPQLNQYSIPRWYGSRLILDGQFHIFCDGSETGYGAVVYLVTPVVGGRFHSAFVMAKSRLAPLRKASIPRLELTSAKLAVTLMVTVKQEIPLAIGGYHLWTDSETVLKYIKNEKKRFQRFVSNRISFIRERTEVGQWKHVPGDLNPADIASRGSVLKEFVASQLWKEGPEFLKTGEKTWPQNNAVFEIDENDPEIKKAPVFSVTTKVEIDVVTEFLESISDWHILLRTVVGFLKFQAKLQGRVPSSDLQMGDLDDAETAIIRFEQLKSFEKEIGLIRNSRPLLKKSTLDKFSPFIDEKGLLRVGGRLTKAENLSFAARHPIILSRGHVSILLIRRIHDLVGHLGKSFIISKLREKYRIVGEGGLVKKVLRNCIKCRRYQGKPEEQVMADLPEDRILGHEPPFTNTGIDLFGPFKTSRGRALQDRYALIFTCLASRGAHLEVVYDKSTDSFIQALRRFIARRGQVKRLRSDNGTNFIGAERELRENLEKLNQDQIKEEMMKRDIEWIFNPPYSHHFGGVWEREIRTIRKVMSGLMNENQRNLSDESLNTLLCEVEAILNSRPLTAISDDPNDMTPLTPNHLLLQKIGPTHPPGFFQPSDQYAKHRWRQVQHLADLFWKRWSKEYVSDLQCRGKWRQKRPNVAVNDLVLLVNENAPRCQWPLGRIVEVYPDQDGLVRVVKIKTAKNEYRRPISQIVMLRRNDPID